MAKLTRTFDVLMSQGADGLLKATVLPSAKVCSILLTPAEM